jgi:arylsulfatase A-like enzyme
MASDRTNVLLITSDQQHWNTLGCLNSEIQTPNLDRLAQQGTLYNRGYCPNPVCTPTRASIITGQYPSQHGAYALGTQLAPDTRTVGHIFQEAGYRTALVGKAHFQQNRQYPDYPSLEAMPFVHDLDLWRNFTDDFYGFEHIELARNHVDEAQVGQHYMIWMEEKGFDWRPHFGRDKDKPRRRHKWSLPEEFHYNSWNAERTCALLDSYKENEESFFLWSSFPDPHPPYLVPEPWDTMYDPSELTVPTAVEGEHDANPPHFQLTQTEKPDFSPWRESGGFLPGFHSHLFDRDDMAKDIAIYYGMVSFMDAYIGKILNKLDDLGLSENTLVVYTSDHGHFYGQHGLRAKGAFHYEDQIRVPFLVRQPGSVPAGVRSESLQTLVDLAPSFLAASGIEIPRSMSGVDQTPVWYGKQESARDHILVENRNEFHTLNLKTFVDDRYKITAYRDRDYGELFDLQEDPNELANLWDRPECAKLKQDLLLRLLSADWGAEPRHMSRVG